MGMGGLEEGLGSFLRLAISLAVIGVIALLAGAVWLLWWLASHIAWVP